MSPKTVVSLVCLALLGAGSALAASPPGPGPSRRLVILLDGTLNNPEQAVETQGGHKLYKPTNVLKTYRAVLPVAADGRSQITYYSEGVGTFIGEAVPLSGLLTFVENLAGGAFGAGFEARIKAAYRFLVANYQAGDEIFVVGFSRGAAEAQGLVRFVDWAGGLLRKDDEYYIAELYDGFSKSITEQTTVESVLARIVARRNPRRGGGLTCEQQACCESELVNRQARRMACGAGETPAAASTTTPIKPPPINPPRPVEIRFLGVYETVIALGSRFATEGAVTTTPPQFAFLGGKTPPAIVKVARQALSIDEARWDFRPQVWQGPPATAPSMDLEQRWFPGVHSDVGGGYTRDGLANAALQWMTAEAMKAGLEVDCGYLGYYKPWVCGDRPDTDSGFMRFSEIIRGKSGRGVRVIPAGAKLDDSVASLLINDQGYRPRNLLQYLAQDETRIEQFPDTPRLRSRVRAIVEEFKAGTARQAPPCAQRAADSGQDDESGRCGASSPPRPPAPPATPAPPPPGS